MKHLLLALVFMTQLPILANAHSGSSENPQSIRIRGTPDCSMALASARSLLHLSQVMSTTRHGAERDALNSFSYSSEILIDNIPDYCPKNVSEALKFADTLGQTAIQIDAKFHSAQSSDLIQQAMKVVNALQGPNRPQD
jgi:hypothetical protein